MFHTKATQDSKQSHLSVIPIRTPFVVLRLGDSISLKRESAAVCKGFSAQRQGPGAFI